MTEENPNSDLNVSKSCSDMSRNLDSYFSITSKNDPKINNNSVTKNGTKTEHNRKRKQVERWDEINELTNLNSVQKKKPMSRATRQTSRLTSVNETSQNQDVDDISLIQSVDLNIQSDKMHVEENEDLFTKEWSSQEDKKMCRDKERNLKSVSMESSSGDGNMPSFSDIDYSLLSDDYFNDLNQDTKSLLQDLSWTGSTFQMVTDGTVPSSFNESKSIEDDFQISNLKLLQKSTNKRAALNPNSKSKDSNQDIKSDVKGYSTRISQFGNSLEEHIKSEHPHKSSKGVKKLLSSGQSGQNLRKYSRKLLEPEKRISENVLTGEHLCLQCDFVSFSKTEALMHSTRDHLSLKVFTCHKCPKLFQFKKNCLDHLKEVHAKTSTMNNEQVQCEICDRNYASQFILLRHYRFKHPELELFSCGECPHEFNSEIKLQNHQRAIHNEATIKMESSDNEFSCIKCQTNFETSQQLKDHQTEVHMKWFSCGQCNYRTKQVGNIERHVKTIHCKEKNFMCPGCFRTFTEKKALETHNDANKAERGTTVMTCEKYTKKYIRDSELIHHDQQKEHYSCLLCSFGSQNLTKLQSHIDGNHHKIKKRVIICNQCQKEFPTKTAILNHWDIDHQLVISIGEVKVKKENSLSYDCSHCGLKFNYEKTLFLHTKKLHSGQPWACNGCSAKFLTKITLLKHVNTIHQNDESIAIPKSYDGCSECPFISDTPTNLSRHVSNVHLKERNFMCEECGKSYSDKKGLSKHNASKHGDIFGTDKLTK